jgi:NitT/TauT family transport system substrate-binding protein
MLVAIKFGNLPGPSFKARSKASLFSTCILICLLLPFALSCTPQPQFNQRPDEITLQLKWIHQAQFAGFYVAQEKGYYAAENLRVDFVQGGPGIDNVFSLTSGAADFGILSPEEILISRGNGYPVTGIAAIFRRGAVVMLVKTESGIKKPADFIGKTAAVKSTGSFREGEIQFQAVLKKLGIDSSRIEIISWEPDYRSFINGTADITTAYTISGKIRLANQGFKLNVIRPDDYGIHFYSDTICANEEVLINRPDITLRFLRASLKGWNEAISEYKEAIQTTLKYNGNIEPEFQSAMMEALLPLVHTGEDRIGSMKPEIWRGMYTTVKEQNLMTSDFDFNQAFTLDYFNKVQGAKQP